MSYSDDPKSPAASFSGDSTGQIFDLPDIVTSSPTTNERVVDTQSGFLVVIKRVGERLSLSIKRRVGTPPSTSVSLLPDESIKLSKILASGAFGGEEFQRPRQGNTNEHVLLSDRTTAERERPRSRRNRTNETPLPDSVTPPASMSSAYIQKRMMFGSAARTFLAPLIGVSLVLICVSFGAGFGTSHVLKAPAPAVVQPTPDPLSSSNVDKFVRTFVASMLDFGPDTYRASQIQAMAAMKPELMERYWRETNFPLTVKQLKNLPQGVSILITELKQEPADGNVQVDVRAQLTDPKNPKIATPVNLRLTLSLDLEHRIQVLEQQDLSAVAR